MAGLQELANRIIVGLLPSSLNVGAAMLIQVETSFPDVLLARPAGQEGKAVPLCGYLAFPFADFS